MGCDPLALRKATAKLTIVLCHPSFRYLLWNSGETNATANENRNLKNNGTEPVKWLIG